MAAYADIWAQLKASGNPFYELRTAGRTAFLTDGDAYNALIDGAEAPRAASAYRQTRKAYAQVVRRLKQVWEPHLIDMATTIAAPSRSIDDTFWRLLHDYMVANTSTIQRRNITRGNVAAGGSNVGNGTVLRLTADWATHQCEAAHLGVTTLKCIADRQTGTVLGREAFQITNGAVGDDWLDLGGNSGTGSVRSRSGSRDSLIRNASFEVLSGTEAAPTDITDWESSVAVNSTNYSFDNSNTYRSTADELAQSQARSLNVKVTSTIKQRLSVLRATLDPSVPYMLTARVNREVGSFGGTATLRMGATTSDLVLAAQTGWVLHTLALTSGCWPENANTNDLAIWLETARTSGTLLWDDVTFGPMTRYDGAWYYVVPGSTPFLRDDVFTFTDSLAAGEAILQYLVFLYTDGKHWLPSSASPSIADPT